MLIKRFYYLLILLFFITGVACPPPESTGYIEPDDPRLLYTGRINYNDPGAPVLCWSGSSITAIFEGTFISIILNAYESGPHGNNFINAFIDNTGPVVIECLPGEYEYTITQNLKDRSHKIEIVKRTEGLDGNIAFLGFRLDQGKSLLEPPERPVHRIEYYGDSITSGAAIESSENSADSIYKNHSRTYAAITARNINAEYHSISVGGIGLLSSWEWLDGNMPEGYYYRLDFGDPESYWDFSIWTPDYIVIALGHNDFLRTGLELATAPSPDEAIQGYIDFIQTLRNVYNEDVRIILALVNLDTIDILKEQPPSPWPGYIEAAANKMNTYFGDNRVYSILLPYDGAAVHPGVQGHEIIAEALTDFIRGLDISK